ncbi:MAG: hypothetical protein QOD39_2982, partial [Mycobacterium sp.]|nr:hypothetical protein [Mycobacterium sp.]
MHVLMPGVHTRTADEVDMKHTRSRLALFVCGSLVLAMSSVASLPQAAAAPFTNCDQAYAAGVAPLEIGAPGYSADLDRDGDGIACEPAGDESAPPAGEGMV